MAKGFFYLVKSDAKRYENNLSVLRFIRLLVIHTGFQLVLFIRLQHLLGSIPVAGKILRRVLYYLSNIIFGCDINVKVFFKEGLYIPHPVGIVIGDGVSLGKNVSILQNVTIGRAKSGEHTAPQIADNVQISAGAVVVGNITVGENSVIGANAVVTKNIPANRIAVGVPARILDKKA